MESNIALQNESRVLRDELQLHSNMLAEHAETAMRDAAEVRGRIGWVWLREWQGRVLEKKGLSVVPGEG